jgi:hypothetical protein
MSRASEVRAADGQRMTRGVIHAVASPTAASSAGQHVCPGGLIAHDRTLRHPDRLRPMPFDDDRYFGLVREAEAARPVP